MLLPPPGHPVVLLVDDRAVAPAEIARTRRARALGLLGRNGIGGALVVPAASSVHTIAMRFTIDVALCTSDLEVVAVRTLVPGRLVLPRRRVAAVVEAEAGAFTRWGLAQGSRLTLA